MKVDDICKLFFETFRGKSIPDRGFASSWQSSTPEQIKVAMDKAKIWLSTRPEKNVLDAARIVSAILHDERNRAKVYHEDHFSADALRIKSRHSLSKDSE